MKLFMGTDLVFLLYLGLAIVAPVPLFLFVPPIPIHGIPLNWILAGLPIPVLIRLLENRRYGLPSS